MLLIVMIALHILYIGFPKDLITNEMSKTTVIHTFNEVYYRIKTNEPRL